MGLVDTKALKERHDLRRIVEQDLGPAPARSRRASLWKCPFHGERKGYSLAVWADGYCCFGKCQIGGDAIDWLQRYHHLSFDEAVRMLDGGLGPTPVISTHRPEPSDDDPPPMSWQVVARQVVDLAEETLWSSQGEPARDYLLERGLAMSTIQTAHLGYIPGGYREWRTVAGVSVPCGITLPWLTNGEEILWAVKVRRASGSPKYLQIAGGSRGGLYQADRLKGARAALFCEGEFDTLLAQQEGEPLVAAVTVGSASSHLNRRWLAELVSVPIILAAYDVDQAGEKGAARLQALSGRVQVIHVPWGKDLTEFHQQGGNLYSWLARELRCIRQNAILAATGR
ncbi:MAG TPA: CHC2 zinc finger domain-containing protein [Aggregatilinea sp.]|uniref:CHC2 zinc finger domain-containing protein n=1 Tax=Aggregatilinea sp. TaxID=2806333 RepID=UPI002CD8B3E6|nr:CHC2 zinc finger domain-containing protein [Aggregatilinea sp.]HML21013.1 CHC2 zinc finger domain-containing protein [Aggregatilinea sp.]